MLIEEQLVTDFYAKISEVPLNMQVVGPDWITTDKHIFRFGWKGKERYISCTSIKSYNRELKRAVHEHNV